MLAIFQHTLRCVAPRLPVPYQGPAVTQASDACGIHACMHAWKNVRPTWVKKCAGLSTVLMPKWSLINRNAYSTNRWSVLPCSCKKTRLEDSRRHTRQQAGTQVLSGGVCERSLV